MSEPSLIWTFAPFSLLKWRNSALDLLFYDVFSLSPSEIAQLLLIPATKGSVVVVPPRDRGPIRYYPRTARFIIRELREISTIAVAGVGSSLVGAAALARNVADARGEPVAAIVSGYGVSDVVSEALGGWFFFGSMDRFRRWVDQVSYEILNPGARGAAPRGEVVLSTDVFDPGSPGFGLPGDGDAVALSNVFLAQPAKLDLLVGHSKGSLVIDAALEEYVDTMGRDDGFAGRLRVITLSAVSDIPSTVRTGDLWQFLGGFDWFGALNSSFGLGFTEVPGAWHHLNRMLPFHLDAVAAIADALGEPPPPPGRGDEAPSPDVIIDARLPGMDRLPAGEGVSSRP